LLVAVARSVLECQYIGERRSGTVTALDSAIHEAEEVGAGMLAGQLQTAVERGFRHHVKQCGVLSRFGAGIAAKREGYTLQNQDVTALGSRLSAIFCDILGRSVRKASSAD
jgi:hypothetical protein